MEFLSTGSCAPIKYNVNKEYVESHRGFLLTALYCIFDTVSLKVQ